MIELVVTPTKTATTFLLKHAKTFLCVGLITVGLFAYLMHLAKQETLAFSSLDPAAHDLLQQARLIQTESASACFLYAGQAHESKWLRHFGKNRGWPHLRDCGSGLYSHLMFWGDLSKTDYTRTHVIVFQKHAGYLLSPARPR